MATIWELGDRWVCEQILQKLQILEMWSFSQNNMEPNKKESHKQIHKAFPPGIQVMPPFAAAAAPCSSLAFTMVAAEGTRF